VNEQRQRYPLAWPMTWKRTRATDRRRAAFRRIDAAGPVRRDIALTIAAALDRLDGELRRLGASDEILSSNVPVGIKGLPYSSAREPIDPGVAVYIRLDRKDLVFACDKWDRVADNIAAIAQHIDALRRIERYGVGRVDQAFVGYVALPPSADDWRIVLGVGEFATLDQVDAAFLQKAKDLHPDVGGTHDDMAKLTAARDLARKVLRGELA
jgi:hypothetical protein